MKINEYYKPENLDDACSLLDSEGAAVIAGGGWLKLLPKTISKAVDLQNLGLNFINDTQTTLEIGAMTTLRQVERSQAVQAIGSGILSEAVHSIMSVPFRNIATFGGSVAGKFGFSDLLAPLLVLDAVVVLHKAGNMPLEGFLTTKIKGDIVTKIIIPKKEVKGHYRTVKKTANDFPIVNLAILKDGDRCKIAVGSRPGVAMLAKEASKYLSTSSNIDEASMEACLDMVLSELNFASNIRASKAYRKDLVKVLVKRGLKEVGYDY